MSDKTALVLNCYRCSKTATVYIPDTERVLCDQHFSIFNEAYSTFRTSAILIEDYLIDSIKEKLDAKEASDRATGIEFNHRVPVTLITDHLGELATGVQPATCKSCGSPMQLHAQWTTTKQQFTGSASKGALDPDFLKKFDEHGNCLDCRTNDGISRGFYLVDVPMSRDDMIAHLNGHGHGPDEQQHRQDSPVPQETESGDVHRQEILGSPMATINKLKAESMNFPIYVDEDGWIQWNEKHRAKQPVIFPLGMGDWTPETDDKGNAIPGTGMTFPSYNWFHSFLDHITGFRDGEFTAPNSCGTCDGTGMHPEIGEDDVSGYFEEARIKAERAQQRDLRSKPKSKSKSAHAGPGVKPHDHHNKKKKYAPRKTGPMGRSSTGSLPVTKGPGSAFKVPGTGGFRIPGVERWWYDQMNMFHDITHTEYKTPSYMYRNPNPMYYSPGSRREMPNKPWKN